MLKLGEPLPSSVFRTGLPYSSSIIGSTCVNNFLSKVFEIKPCGDFGKILPQNSIFFSLGKSCNS
jgi:hypothetical protein